MRLSCALAAAAAAIALASAQAGTAAAVGVVVATGPAPPAPPELPPNCQGTLSYALCDSAGMLPRRAVRRVLHAALLLAERRCRAVLIIFGALQAPTPRVGCELRVHATHRAVGASLTGRVLSSRERRRAVQRLEERLLEGWSVEAAVLEALRGLGRGGDVDVNVEVAEDLVARELRRNNQRRRRLITFLVICSGLVGVLLGCGRHFPQLVFRPHYERCRRALQRLDDSRTRARASKYPNKTCPICLEALRPVRKRRRNASSVAAAGAASATATATAVTITSASTSSSSGSDDGKRRSLPCGHTYHAACLLKWVASSARNRDACPVCRTPVPGGLPPSPFSWRAVTSTVLSDNLHGERRSVHPVPVSYEESSGTVSVQDIGGMAGGSSEQVVVQWGDETGGGGGGDVGSEVTPSSVHDSHSTAYESGDASQQDSSSHYGRR